MASGPYRELSGYPDSIRETMEMIIREGKGPQPKPKPKPKDYHRENLNFIKQLQTAKQMEKQSKHGMGAPKSGQVASSRYASAIGYRGKEKREDLFQNAVVPHTLGYIPPYVTEHNREIVSKRNTYYSLDERTALQTLDDLERNKTKLVNKLENQLSALKNAHDIGKEKNKLVEMLDTIERGVMMYTDPKVTSAKYFISRHRLCYPENKPALVTPHPLGYIPSYVTEWKKLAGCPPGYTLMDEEERLLTYELLLKVKDEVLKILMILRQFRDPQSIEKERKEFEMKLDRVDEGLAIFSCPRVFIKQEEI